MGKDKNKNEIGIVNLDEKGGEIETFFFEDSLSNEASAFVEIRDIGLGIIGTTVIGDSKKMLTIGTNREFGVIWKKIDPKEGDENDEGRAIAQSVLNEDIVVLGKMGSLGAGNGDLGYYIRDNRGKWRGGGTAGGEQEDEGFGVSPCKDGGYVLVGTTQSFESKYSSVILIKIDKKGKYNKDDHKHYEDVTFIKNFNTNFYEGNVFPNPINKETVLDLTNYMGKFPLEFTMMDIDGRILEEFKSYLPITNIYSNRIGRGIFLS